MTPMLIFSFQSEGAPMKPNIIIKIMANIRANTISLRQAFLWLDNHTRIRDARSISQ